MSEKIEVTVLKELNIKAVDGGMFIISDGTTTKAVASGAALLKQVTAMLEIKKQTRGPKKGKK